MGLFTTPRRLSRRIGFRLPIRWHSEWALSDAVRRVPVRLLKLPRGEHLARAWRWFVGSPPAVAAALLLSIFALLGALVIVTQVGL